MRKLLMCLSMLMICLLMASCALAWQEGQALMQLHQVEVGCANCYLLISGETVILIDGGTNAYKPSTAPASQIETGNSPKKMLEYIAATGIDHIDAHFVTHYHNDHAQQIPDFSRSYGTEDTILYGTSRTLPDRYDLPNGKYQHLKDDDELDVGPFHVHCVGPTEVRREGEINEDSLNLLITYGSFRMLFTGDYYADASLNAHLDEVRNVDVFQYPHHGLTPYAVTVGALRELNPKVIVVPGDAVGSLRVYLMGKNIRPEIYGNYSGNFVIFSDGLDYTVQEHVQPGEIKFKE